MKTRERNDEIWVCILVPYSYHSEWVPNCDTGFASDSRFLTGAAGVVFGAELTALILQEVCDKNPTLLTQPQKGSPFFFFSTPYLQYYLIHYSICMLDKMSNPKTGTGTPRDLFQPSVGVDTSWIESMFGSGLRMLQRGKRDACLCYKPWRMVDSDWLPFPLLSHLICSNAVSHIGVTEQTTNKTDYTWRDL